VALLAVAAATQVAAASDRFVPQDPNFVVANIRAALPDLKLQRLLAAWRTAPDSDDSSLALADAFINRARVLREPRYFGRAEALLAPRAARPGASASTRRLYAQVLQYRHAFAEAEALLDSILRELPHDDGSRLLRASIRLVRGDFAGARSDCAQLASRGGASAGVGIACLAEGLAGGGKLERGRALLDSVLGVSANADPRATAYLLATRAELRERAGEIDGAIADYSASLTLAAGDDSIRASLADALAARGDAHEAVALLAIEKPSLALVVRSAVLSQESSRATLVARANAWLALERARGDAVHDREAAMLALLDGNPVHALDAARRNFAKQKELTDVRLLARAARAANDTAAVRALRRWLDDTGYQDVVTENILSATAGS
jgi:hypothetical protein